MTFLAGISPPEDSVIPGRWFVFYKDKLLIKKDGDHISVPQDADLLQCALSVVNRQYLGLLDRAPCFAAEVSTEPTLSEKAFEFKNLRSLFTRLDEELLWIAGRANQLLHWHRTHIYCGACGHRTEDKDDERAKRCPHCGLINYPRLSPAMIVAVLKGDKILLAHNRRFQIPIYSVLAGFVEPGETLEQCVRREVKEEVGIDIKQIRYFGSQPWPFPNSLMVAFTAEYAGGEIVVDNKELMDAGWFSRDNLPQVPTTISIAGQLIEWFRQQ